MESYEMESWHQYDMYTWLIVMFSEILYETDVELLHQSAFC